jgi:transcriptional regulator with XRE-family HTH domain
MANFSDIFSKFRLKSGKSQREFAEMLGIPQTTWAGYEQGKSEPKLGTLLALAEMGYTIEGLGVNGHSKRTATLSKHPGNPIPIYQSTELPVGSFEVPLLDQRLSAGQGVALPEKDETRALIRAPAYLARYGENIAALTVDGDSMEPTLHRGDTVVCDACGWSGEGIYAVWIGGFGFVKRITKAPGKVVIISDNPKYPAREEPEGSEDFSLIGRVHCAITKVD